MKRKLLIICLMIVSLMMNFLFGPISFAEDGLLPSLSETVGIAMPSLGEALQRYPDSETENEDGSVTELYTNVSETDFNTFSVYLEQQKAELADYKAEKGVLSAEIRAKGASFNLQYDTKSGEVRVIYPSGTFDEWVKSAKIHYDAGRKLLEEDKADEALTEFYMIPQYSEYAPVADLLKNDKKLINSVSAEHERKLEPYRKIGNVVTFGRWYIHSTWNGLEAIEWIVLDYNEQEQKVLLLSRYGLYAIPYNVNRKDSTWEQCTLRSWLNDEFMKTAFSPSERDAILKTKVENNASQGYNQWVTDGGNETQDQIFLLSYAEVNRYLGVTFDDVNNIKACASLSAYAIMQHAWSSETNKTEDGEPIGWWWLRSPGNEQDCAAIVNDNGALDTKTVDSERGVVRPAFWLNLESDIF